MSQFPKELSQFVDDGGDFPVEFGTQMHVGLSIVLHAHFVQLFQVCWNVLYPLSVNSKSSSKVLTFWT